MAELRPHAAGRLGRADNTGSTGTGTLRLLSLTECGGEGQEGVEDDLPVTAQVTGERWCHLSGHRRGAGVGVRGWRQDPELSLGLVVSEVLVHVQWQKRKRKEIKVCATSLVL